MPPRIAFYGRMYWDVEVRIPIEAVAGAKSKVDAPVSLALGGFACNAARAVEARFPTGAVRVVTRALDRDLLRRSLSKRIGIDAIPTKSAAGMPPISVILDPGGACRIFRDRGDRDAAEWRADRVPASARAASLHVLGRLPIPFAEKILERCHAAGARFAWCGGDSLPIALEQRTDILCVNTAEASRMLGTAGQTPRALAEGLAYRARVGGAVRVVTGGGRAPTAAAIRAADGIHCHEAANRTVAREKIRRLLGVGDAFAGHFLATACFDERGVPRASVDVKRGLSEAQRAAAKFIQS